MRAGRSREVIGRKDRAGNAFIDRVRKNWYWGRTHGWADLIEEHDIDPRIRGRRALRKLKWRWVDRDRRRPSTPVFLVGAQRSGTNMLAHGLDEAPELQVFNEGNRKAFHHFRLRQWGTIETLVDRSPADLVLFKPLCDSHKAVEMLERFSPRGRVIWAYRDVDGRVRSAVAKFGDSNLRVLRAYAAGDADDAWQVQGVSSVNADFVRSFDFDRLSAESAAALFWYIRNSLFFENSLDQRGDTMLASYDQVLADPERAFRALCAFIGLRYRPELVAHIQRRPAVSREPLEIDSRIREHCSRLQERLDAVCVAQVSRFAARTR